MSLKRRAVEDSLDEIYESSAQLLRSPSYGDVTFFCKGRTWRCSRDVLCQRESGFERWLSGDLKESEIRLDGDDPEAVDIMLRYLYTQQYRVADGAPGDDAVQKTLWSGVLAYATGDRYGMFGLKEAARPSILSAYKALAHVGLAEPFLTATEKIWEMELVDDSDKIRDDVVGILTQEAYWVMDNEQFLDLCEDYPSLTRKFMTELKAKGSSKDWEFLKQS